MDTFTLKVVATNRVFYDGPCQMLVIPAIDGEKGIMAHNEDMVIAVEIGELRLQKPDGEWLHAVVSRGFAQVSHNRVTMLVLSAERPEEIDVRRAEEARERAQEQLRQKQSLEEYHISQASLARAMARLKEASKFRPRV